MRKHNVILLFCCLLTLLLFGCHTENVENVSEENSRLETTTDVSESDENSLLISEQADASESSSEDFGEENSSFELPPENQVVGHYVDMTDTTFIEFWHKEEFEKWLEGTSNKKIENNEFEIVGLYEYDRAEKARKFMVENSSFAFLIGGKKQPVVPDEQYSFQILCGEAGVKVSYKVKLKETEMVLVFTGYYNAQSEKSILQHTANGGYFDIEIYDKENDKCIKTKALSEIGETFSQTSISFEFGKWNVSIFSDKKGYCPIWNLENIGFSSFLAEDVAVESFDFSVDFFGNGYEEKLGFAFLKFENVESFASWLDGSFKGEINIGTARTDTYSDEYLEYARTVINEKGVSFPAAEDDTGNYIGGIWVKCDRFKKVRIGFSKDFEFKYDFSLAIDYSRLEGYENIVDFLEKENAKYGDVLYSFDPEASFHRVVEGESSEKINAVFWMDGVESRLKQTEYFVYDGLLYILKYNTARYYNETQQFDFVFRDLK